MLYGIFDKRNGDFAELALSGIRIILGKQHNFFSLPELNRILQCLEGLRAGQYTYVGNYIIFGSMGGTKI